MKRIFMLLAIAIMAIPVYAQQEAFPSYIQVNGYAEKEVAPDLFYLSITLKEIDSKGKITIEDQRKDMINVLKKIGIDVEKHLRVINISSSYFKRSTSFATARFQLELTSATEVEKTYEALGSLGISDISISNVTHSKIAELTNEIRSEAIRNAKATATTLAESLGQSVGKCFYIYDSNSDAPVTYNSNFVMARSMKANITYDAVEEETEPLEFKTIKLRYSVNAKFVLE